MNEETRTQTVAISGVTGFIGKALRDFFARNHHRVIPLTREKFSWSVDRLAREMEGVGAIYHLAGAPVLRKWNTRGRKVITSSRVDTTHKLVEAIRLMSEKPDLFFSASAVGIYDPYEVHDEFSSHYSNDFLSEVCQSWEKEALQLLGDEHTRLIIGRLGVVLDAHGGAFPRMMQPFKWGVGNIIGHGYQSFSFIHLNDVLGACWYLWKKSSCTGVFNLVAPELVSYEEFAHILAKELNTKVRFRIPEKMLSMRFGAASRLLTLGQKVLPTRLMNEQYPFEFPDMTSAIAHLVKQ
jgi:uncharacterized protein (TIGR01777 family)